MRGDTLLKDILEGRIKGKKQSGRTRCKTLDWMMNRDDGCIHDLKEMAQCRRTWKDWRLEPALGQITERRKKEGILIKSPRSKPII